jgi:hypothetical protein
LTRRGEVDRIHPAEMKAIERSVAIENNEAKQELTYKCYYHQTKGANNPSSDRLAFDIVRKRQVPIAEDGKIENEVRVGQGHDSTKETQSWKTN